MTAFEGKNCGCCGLLPSLPNSYWCKGCTKHVSKEPHTMPWNAVYEARFGRKCPVMLWEWQRRERLKR